MQLIMWSMLSSGSPHFKRHACDGAMSSFGSRLRTKSARCSSFRQLRSSVASDSGVPRVGQILSKGMGGPLMRDCQLASQLGRFVSTAWCVKSFVRRLMLIWGIFVMAYSGSGWGSAGVQPSAMGKACEGGPMMYTRGGS